MFNFRLTRSANGNTIVDTTRKTPMDSLTPTELIEYIEVDSQLFALERERKRKEEALQKRAKMESTIISYATMTISTCVAVWGLITFDAWTFIMGCFCAVLAQELPFSIVGFGLWMQKANDKIETYMECRFPKLWEILNS